MDGFDRSVGCFHGDFAGSARYPAGMVASADGVGQLWMRRALAVVTAVVMASASSPAAAQPAERAGAPPPAEVAVEASDGGPVFVVGGGVGLNLGLSSAPSLEPSLFLGGSLPMKRRPPGGWVALGLQSAASVGRADSTPYRAKNGLTLRSEDPFLGIFVHRHHIAVQGAAGREGRLAYGAGFGLVHAGGRGVGLEGDGRLGYVFTKDSRVQGSFGGMLRVTGVFGESAQPQFGMFLAFTRAPLGPVAPLPGAPRRGVVLMTVGGLLLAAAPLEVLAAQIEIKSACRAGSCEGDLGFVTIVVPILVLMGVAGITCLAVGAKRHRRHREWRARQARLEVRGAGLAF